MYPTKTEKCSAQTHILTTHAHPLGVWLKHGQDLFGAVFYIYTQHPHTQSMRHTTDDPLPQILISVGFAMRKPDRPLYRQAATIQKTFSSPLPFPICLPGNQSRFVSAARTDHVGYSFAIACGTKWQRSPRRPRNYFFCCCMWCRFLHFDIHGNGKHMLKHLT